MAYTTLPTQSAGGTASAAGWANIVKADLESMMHLVARKTSDQSVTSSTTLVNDTTLQLTVAANEIWRFEIGLVWTGNLSGNIRIAFTFPASGNISASTDAHDVGGTFEKKLWLGTTTPTTATDLLYQGGGGSENNFHLISGVYVNAGTAGTLIMQWAQNSSFGTATTVKANSTLWGMKLAP